MVAAPGERLLDLPQLLEAPGEVGEQMVHEANGDAVLIEVPFVVDQTGQDPRRLDAAQRSVLPVLGVGQELGDSANGDPASTGDGETLFFDAEVQARPVADLLEVLQVAEDLEVEGLESGTLGEALDDRRRGGEGVPSARGADPGRQAGHGIDLEVPRPATDDGALGEAGQLVADAGVVDRPGVT